MHLINTHGIKYIGNFGSGPLLIFRDHSRLPISCNPHHTSAFHARKHCHGCQSEHVWYKCGAKHQAIQCPKNWSGGVNPKGNSTQASGPSQPPVTHVRVGQLQCFLHLHKVALRFNNWKQYLVLASHRVPLPFLILMWLVQLFHIPKSWNLLKIMLRHDLCSCWNVLFV